MFGISQNSLGSGVLKLLHGNIRESQKNMDTKPCSEHLLHFNTFHSHLVASCLNGILTTPRCLYLMDGRKQSLLQCKMFTSSFQQMPLFFFLLLNIHIATGTTKTTRRNKKNIPSPPQSRQKRRVGKFSLPAGPCKMGTWRFGQMDKVEPLGWR